MKFIALALSMTSFCSMAWANGSATTVPPGVVNSPTQVGPASVPAVPVDEPPRSPARLRAEALYNFLTYVEFPASALPQPDTPLVIGTLGADEVQAELADALKGRTVQGRTVLRRRVLEGEALTGLHLLFVGRKVDLAQSTVVSQAVKTNALLLVTENLDGLAAGAVFNVTMQGDRLRFEASLEAAERAALRVSSRILTVAERVTGGR